MRRRAWTLVGIDFAVALPEDALDLAVLIEEEASERYEEFADQLADARTPEAARVLRLHGRQ